MKALVDEQLSPAISVMLRQRGHDVISVHERDDLKAQSDRVIFDGAAVDARAVITNNVKDFRPLAAECLARGGSHHGLILLPPTRSRTRAQVSRRVDAIERILQDNPHGLRDSERWIAPSD